MPPLIALRPAALAALSPAHRHVLGMAKSNLDLAGAKRPKLELDLLRLGYAVHTLQLHGIDAQGYILVVVPTLVPAVESWMEKYALGSTVVCLCADLDAASLAQLQEEKTRNVAGMVAGTLREAVAGRSSAAFGQVVGEEALQRLVAAREPGLMVVTAANRQPFGVRWDLYGVVPGPGAPSWSEPTKSTSQV